MLENNDGGTIAIVSLVTSSLSVLGASSILIYVIRKYKCKQKEIFPLWHIWLGDLIAAVLQCFGSLLYILKVKNDILCAVSTTVTPSFYVVTFLLTMMYALETLLRRKKILRGQSVQNQAVSHKSMYALYFLSWVVPPAVGIGITVSQSNNSSDSECLPVFHLDDSRDDINLTHKFLFFLPLILVLIINACFCAAINYTVKKYNIQRGYRERRREATLLKRMVAYQITLFVCWLPSIFLGFGTVITRNTFHMSTFTPVYILQAILAPLQGFINCIAYGWSKVLVRELPPEERGLLKRLKVFRTNNPEALYEDTSYQSLQAL